MSRCIRHCLLCCKDVIDHRSQVIVLHLVKLHICHFVCFPPDTIYCLTLQLLYDTFNAFGVIVQTPKIMRDPETGLSRGFGFVSYDSFEASDAAIEAMNGQFLCNR
jgi:RNA recognition motif. (a.k.a. RRM, RBD, or RNP domain)